MRIGRSVGLWALVACACDELVLVPGEGVDAPGRGASYDALVRGGDASPGTDTGSWGRGGTDGASPGWSGDAGLPWDVGSPPGDASAWDATPWDASAWDAGTPPEDAGSPLNDDSSTDAGPGGAEDIPTPPFPDADSTDAGEPDPPDPCATASCEDGLWCTADWCTGGACQHAHDVGCLIAGVCWQDGDGNPANGCERCSPLASPGGWTWDPGIPMAPAAPPGSASNRIDVATLSCSACGKSCPATSEKCLCLDDFQALNAPGYPHFLALGTDTWRPAAWAKGNFAAVYIDDLNGPYFAGKSGKQAVDELLAAEAAQWPGGLASWFVVNEISAGTWPANSAYRQYVVDYAKALKAAGKKPVILSPFATPGNAWPEWKELAATAFVGAESYKETTGEKVNASGNSVAYCKAAYMETVNAYASVGVPLSKLFLVEHFGQTPKGEAWGRAGVSAAGWKNAIIARGNAAKQIGFAGFISYGWGTNKLGVSAAERLTFVEAYNSVPLP